MSIEKNISLVIESFLSEEKQVVYHGTNNTFSSFDVSKISLDFNRLWNGAGFYFSDNKAQAALYGDKLIRVKINLNNPIDLRNAKDGTIRNSGLIRFLSKLNGFENVQYEGHLISEIRKTILNLENTISKEDFEFAEGSNKSFSHVFYEYGGKEYVLKNRTGGEISDANYMLSLFARLIIKDKYNITRFPIRINEIMNPYEFTKIAKQNGYDGVINYNSTASSGLEYVVFDPENITILNNNI